jgi:hypothetical protein
MNLKIVLTLNQSDLVNSTNSVKLQDPVTISLNNTDNSGNSSHTGDDYYVIQTLIDLMMSNHKNEVVTFNEAMRATVIGCMTEISIKDGEQVYIC